MSTQPGSFTTWWADRYTRGLPAEVRDRRREEIACDVFEQQVRTASERRPTSITWRSVRGIPADMSWRRQEMRAMRANSPEPHESRLRNTWAVVTQRWFAPIAVLLVVFNVLFAWAVLMEDAGKMPGQAIGPVLLVLCAAAIAAGLWMRWRAAQVITSRPAPVDRPLRAVGNRPIAALIAVLVVTLALLVIGVSSGSVPVFLLALAVLGFTALAFGGRAVVRALRSSDIADKAGLADGLVIVGTLPSLGMFWMVIPPLLALVVIGGVLGTHPRFRPAV